MNTSLRLTKSQILERIINEAELLKKTEEEFYFHKIYRMDPDKPEPKKFIARQPSITKEHRQKIKKLLVQFLILKIKEPSINISDYEDSLDDEFPEDEDIFRFKINLSNSQPTWFELSKENLGKYSIISFERNEKKEHRKLKGKEKIPFQKGLLTRIFNGSQLENISFRVSEKKPDSFWTGWKTSMCMFNQVIDYFPAYLQHNIYAIGEIVSDSIPAWDDYKQIIHPAILDVSLEVLNGLAGTCPNVVEICGGEGDLAIQMAKNYPNQMKYYLLEYNDRSLYLANNRILNEIHEDDAKIIPIKTDITNSDDYFLDAEKKNPINRCSIDLIIGSGALTNCVLESKKIALGVAEKCYDLLKPGGKLILAGHARSLLNCEDFTSLGFKVINSYFVGVKKESFTTHVEKWSCSLSGYNKEFYVLEK